MQTIEGRVIQAEGIACPKTDVEQSTKASRNIKKVMAEYGREKYKKSPVM